VDEDVLLGVIAVDETVAGLDVEPFDGAGDLGGDNFFRFFLLSVGGGRWIGSDAVGVVVLGRCRHVLRVVHDGKMVSLTTCEIKVMIKYLHNDLKTLIY